MTNDVLARSFLDRARVILEEARASLVAGHHDRVVRKCQESAELAGKGILRLLGVDYPKAHAFGSVLEKALVEKAGIGAEEAATLSAAVDRLAAQRGAAFYGDEHGGIPAADLFDAEDAGGAMLDARRILEAAERLVGDSSLGGQ